MTESENDAIYIEPELNLWWKIKKIFSISVVHPNGFINKTPQEIPSLDNLPQPIQQKEVPKKSFHFLLKSFFWKIMKLSKVKKP